ncbi:unnamed protein product [Allacma fusca]|uniref:Cytochrome P450 n=1 Tax=Allacma fusca TaxID=39272 RepID=A0A8J2K7P9_9HEXA|nr:unnamed protein product [Allacma fusca]
MRVTSPAVDILLTISRIRYSAVVILCKCPAIHFYKIQIGLRQLRFQEKNKRTGHFKIETRMSGNVLGVIPVNCNWAWAVATGLVAILYWAVFVHESRLDRMLKKFPGYKDYPIAGHGYMFVNPEDTLTVLDGWLRQYGKRCRVYYGSYFKVLMLSNPIDIEKVAKSPELIEKSSFYNHVKVWLGDGLLISKGKKWYTHRKLLTPAFHFKILENFQPIFDDNSKVLVNVLKKFEDKECEIQGIVNRCTLDVICETAMGKQLNSLLDENNPFLRATLRESELLWMRMTNPWFQNSIIWNYLSKCGKEEKANRKILHSFTAEVIKERKKTFASKKASQFLQQSNNDDDESGYFGTKQRFAFLDLLLNIQAAGEYEMTDEDIQAETDTFMFEGHDTTAAAISWAIYLLGLNPLQQAVVHEELDGIFGDDKTREVESADLPKLKYLEMCIKEALRLYPSVPLISRAVFQDFKLDDGSIIPKEALIVLNAYSAHRDPDNFPQPEEYRPERFSLENTLKRHPYAYIPFSAGSRNCIGQKFAMAEVKTILANIFRNFQVQSLHTPDKVKAVAELVLRAKNGIRMKFNSR